MVAIPIALVFVIRVIVVVVVVVAFCSAFVNWQLIFWAIDPLYAFGWRAKNAINEKMKKLEKLYV